MALVLNGLSNRQDSTTDPTPSRWLQGLAGPGTVLLFLAGTFSAIDWGMSLDPQMDFDDLRRDAHHRRRAGDVGTDDCRGPIPGGGSSRCREIATPGRLNDLGNLLLAFVMLWAYMSFCQFLIIWSGNLTEEIPVVSAPDHGAAGSGWPSP